MQRVALVYPYFRTHVPTELLFSPLGVAYLAAELHEAGIEVRVFDCTFSTFEAIQASLIEYQPEIVGIYCMVTLSRSTFRLAEMVRQNLPEALLAAGGPLPTLYPGRFTGPFDVVFRGEADLSFPRFCVNYLAMPAGARKDLSALPLEAYDGLYLRQGDLHIDNPSVHCPEDELDAFPMPYRADFDHAAYQQESLRKSGVRTTSIITTYGCPYDCDFCSRPVFGSRFRRRDLDRVMEEIEDILRLGYDSLWIADDSFTLDLRYLEAFCRRMEGRHISWSCLSRVDRIDAAIAGRMKAAGCRKVYLGLESGSQDVLTLMNKKATLEDGIRAVNVFHEAGVETAAFFIVGYPGETVESIEKTFALSLSLPLNEISFNVPFPLPGSRLFERVSELDISKDWDKENEVTFVYHSEFDEAWLRRRIEETLQLFENKTKH